jgi:hypothetical protein
VPRLLEASDVADALLVVSFDQDIAEKVGGKARHLAWDNLPGVLTDYARGRDEIVRRVDELVDELATERRALIETRDEATPIRNFVQRAEGTR